MWVIKDKFKRGYLKKDCVAYSKILANACIFEGTASHTYANEVWVEVELNDKGNYRLKRGDTCLVERKKRP